MLGAIAGDIIGSVYEHRPIKQTAFPLFVPGSRFTDDTVLTVAVAQAILEDRNYGAAIKRLARRYPDAGYGRAFRAWLLAGESRPYQSWGNGAAMRASPIGFAFDSVEDVLSQAAQSAAVTHDHPEGIKGAQAAALAVFLARTGADKRGIKSAIAERFGYPLDRRLDHIRPAYVFDVSSRGSVPESILAFLEAEDFEDAVRKAISLGGDSDTMAAIAGGIAQAYYGAVPPPIAAQARQRLPEEFIAIIDRFNRIYGSIG